MASVAYTVFLVVCHLSESTVVSFGDEYRVVAESLVAMLFGGDSSFYRTIEKMSLSLEYKGYYRPKWSSAIIDVF